MLKERGADKAVDIDDAAQRVALEVGSVPTIKVNNSKLCLLMKSDTENQKTS